MFSRLLHFLEGLNISFQNDQLSRAKVVRSGSLIDKLTVSSLFLCSSTQFQALIPNSKCEYEIRIGDVADGGKIMCAPWKCKDNCVAYSLGKSIKID